MREKLSEIYDPNRYYGVIRARVEEYISNADGKFYLSDIYDYAEARDDRSKSAVRMAVKKAREEERVKPDSDRAGCYRRVEEQFEIINLASITDTAPLKFNLPLGLGAFVQIFPKDLIVYSGVPNEGKSCFLLEAVRLNMNLYNCFYFSTEMSGRACRNRIVKHRNTPLSEWKFNFVESFNDYEDVVQPNDLNIFDYISKGFKNLFAEPMVLQKKTW